MILVPRFNQLHRTIIPFARARNMSSTTSKSTLLMPFSPKTNSEVKIPKFIYGTAWKKERTAGLVYEAIKSGFRAIDTAAQPRHYREDLVCEGIKRAIDEGIVKRNELHIQTKFTPPSGQDPHNMPYDASAPLETQITDSINSSLKNFTFSSGEEPYIDTLLLHSPLSTIELNLKAFTLLASYVPTKIRSLGISNTDGKTLIAIHDKVPIAPCVVQNRFYPATGHDSQVRSFCQKNGILYESFWTLTGNPGLMKSKPVETLAKKLDGDKALALYSLIILGLRGISILDGTTNLQHMSGDVHGLDRVAGLVCEGGEWEKEWDGLIEEFKCLI